MIEIHFKTRKKNPPAAGKFPSGRVWWADEFGGRNRPLQNGPPDEFGGR